MKILYKFLLLVGTFFLSWFALSHINWLKIFRINEINHSMESKLGDIIWNLHKREVAEINDKALTRPADSLIQKICTTNNIDPKAIKLHLVNNAEINAFTMPDRHLIINVGLINACENEAELVGVISHEIAHMELNHVMKKLIKELGMSLLVSITTGNKNGQSINSAIHVLTSSAFDRSLEKEADLKAVDYLKNAQINPENFSSFLYRLGMQESTIVSNASWISTHPDSKSRAQYIVEYSGVNTIKTKKILNQGRWDQWKIDLEGIVE